MRCIGGLTAALFAIHIGTLAHGACPPQGPIDAHLAAGRVVFTGKVVEIGTIHAGGFVPSAVFAVSEDFTKRLPRTVTVHVRRREDFRSFDLGKTYTVVATPQGDGSLIQYCQ